MIMSPPIPKMYLKCSEIPIYNFMMCIDTIDLKYLVATGDYPESAIKHFVASNKKLLLNTFALLQEEYGSLTFNKRALKRQKDICTLMYLQAKYNAIIQILGIYTKSLDVDVLELLNDLGCKFDREKDILPQLQAAKKKASSLKNQINIKTISFNKKYNITDGDDDGLSDSVEKTLDKQALMLESNLETGYRINIYKTSVLRWTNLMDSNDAKILAMKNGKN